MGKIRTSNKGRPSTPPAAPDTAPADVETPPGVDEGDSEQRIGGAANTQQPEPGPLPEVPESERIEDELRSIADQLEELGNPDQKRKALAKAHLEAVEERRVAVLKLDGRVAAAHDALRNYNYAEAVPAEARITRLKNRQDELEKRLATLQG